MVKRKYGGSIESAISFRNEIVKYLDDFSNNDDKISSLKSAMDDNKIKMQDISKVLSEKRILNASVFEKKINKILADLNMKDARLNIRLSMLDKTSEKGLDDCEFYIKTNKGHDMKPVISIASGGEISRIMLAIQILMQNQVSKSTIIFDEIDLGVSGKTADNLGNNILSLSKKTQIICISHLPQIASKGNCHYKVFKISDKNETLSNVLKLNNRDRVKEIAKMLSGSNITDSSLSQARHLLGA